MNKEFKKISKDDTIRYVLESDSGGVTSSGSVASMSKSLGGVQRRDNLLVQDASPKLTPRSPVAHAAQKVAKGSGKHTDRKQQSKQVRGEKHKNKDFAENMDHEISMAGSELHSIFQNAKQLHSMIKTKSEEEGLDAWQQSKITKAADYLNSVLQSLQHEMMGEGDRTMSRAAKGMMKYGKDGMKALAKAGREGASEKQLDTIRDKHDHYNEGWSQKYKNSINCSHPKGFSQRAHCAGKRKHNESIAMEMTCPDCGMCETHGDNMMEVKQRLDAKCWKGKHKEGTKIKGGIRVNNCVPNESVAEGGPFSYGKPPRKGSVADLAAKRRKEQDRKTPPIEPKDQKVGNAKVTKDVKEGGELNEKAVSQQQQKFFGMVHAMQKGKKIPGASAELKKTAKDMSKSDAKDFAKTKHAGLPKKVSEFKMALPPTGMSPEEAQKFAADQQARSQSMYQQQQQTQQALPPGAIPGKNSPHPKTHIYDEKLDAWIPGPSLIPTNEDSYMESLSAALEQKLSVNDTPEVWRDDFVNADPAKYKQFRNKTDEKKRHMADVARYRQIQKK
jgi:hypothetical protein